MTPTTDDNGQWLHAAEGALSALWLLLLGAYAKLYGQLAKRDWVKTHVADAIDKHREQDEIRDRQLFSDLIAPVAVELRNIDKKLERLLERK